MSADLITRLRAARETWVTLGAYEFLVRRPTDVGLVRVARLPDVDFLRACLVGWRKVRMIDLVPGGDPVPAPFEIEAAIEWLEDQGPLYTQLVDAIVAMIQARIAAAGDAEKK